MSAVCAKAARRKTTPGTGRFTTSVFVYDREQDHYVCPGDEHLRYEGLHKHRTATFSTAAKPGPKIVRAVL